MDRVSLERGEPHQKAALGNLIQLYIHDFNDFLPPERKIGVGEDGRFPDVLDLEWYWAKADREVWFIRVGGKLAGFALLNRQSHSGRHVDFNMGEFFVARTYRRDGIGWRAAVDLINSRPGQWEIAIGARNTPALAFWPRVLEAVNTDGVETLDGDGVDWTGPIHRCAVR